MHIYQRIRDLREDADLTQKQIADILLLHTTQYRRYECGESDVPLGIAIMIAEYYNVSLDYIAGRTNEKRGLTRSNLSDDERKLLRDYKELDDKSKGRLLERADILSMALRNRDK